MVNVVTLVGRITRDPELKSMPSGGSVCNFSLAVNRNFKNQAGEYDTDFINCVAFNQTATLMERFVAKGQLLAVQGRIQSRNYEDNTGRRIYVTEVIAGTVSFLESKNKTENYTNNDNSAAMGNTNNDTFSPEDVSISIEDDDLPF